MSKITELEFAIYELELSLKVFWHSGEHGQFPLSHNEVLDLIHFLQEKAKAVGALFEEVQNGF